MKYTLLLSVGLIAFNSLNADTSVVPTYVPRSQGCDAVRHRVGGWDVLYDTNENARTVSGSIGYTQSFSNHTIARDLFGNDISQDGVIAIQGSQFASKVSDSWLADNLYLNCEYDGSITFKPSIKNFVFDLDLYVELDSVVPGLYIRAYAPLVWTKWNTGFEDCGSGATSSCRAGYMTPNGSEMLLATAGDYFAGNAPSAIEGVTFHPLQFAKMGCGDESKGGFAELRMELGWYAYTSEKTIAQINFIVSAPTSMRRKAEFAFHPTIGDGNHWQVGGSLALYHTIKVAEEKDFSVGLFSELQVMHIFNAYEQRTFDIVDKPNSRYMLASKFSENIQSNLSGSDVPDTSAATSLFVTGPIAQFANEYAPVANLTTAEVAVKCDAQIDWVSFVHMQWKRYSLDFGYEFWFRSCEKIGENREGCCIGQPSLFDESQRNMWTLKGDAQMFGYASASSGGLTVNDAVPLSTSQSDATIHAGTNTGAAGTNPELRNLNSDNARFAYAGTNNQRLKYASTVGNVEASHIKTSIDPIFINFENIDLQSIKGMSHKLFAFLYRSWEETKYTPSLGLGASVEIGSNSNVNGCDTAGIGSFVNEEHCLKSSLSQWSLWLKGALRF